MLPAAFVLLEKIPLNPNGKLDRSALPAPSTAIAAHQAFVAPSTPIEATLAGLWCEVLDLARVSVVDNFFALGGHSLALMRLSLRVRDTFQVELPLHSFFDASTVADLAALIEYQLDTQGAVSIEPIHSIYRDDDMLPALDLLSDADIDRLLQESLLERS